MSTRRPVPTPEQLEVQHPVPGYPGLYVQRTPAGGAGLRTRWDRRVGDDTTRIVGGIGPYMNTGPNVLGSGVEDPVEVILANLQRWLCWPTMTDLDVERARTWTPEVDW